ncbi:MAG TPA: ABC transporter permease [Anaerolineae bacterium]|nr:ABC transporter permease [Anaerolineae bacterium]
MHLNAIAAIAAKDLVDAIKNFRLLAIILLPIGFSLLYGFIFKDTPSGAALVVYDPGGSQFVQSLGAGGGWSLWVVGSEAEVAPTVTEKKALAGIVLPPDFDARLAAGERPPLKLLSNGEQANRTGARRLVIDLAWSQSKQPLPIDLVESTINPPPSAQTSPETAPASAVQSLSVQTYLLTMWSIMSIAMVGMYMVPALLVEEKERKTLDAVLVAPVSYLDLIAGKALVGMVYALLSAGLVFALNAGTQVVSVGALIGVSVLSALFATLIGLWLGGMINNTQSLNTWSSFPLLAFLLPAILGAVPNNPFTSILQFYPPMHTLEGISRALSGESLDRIWVNLLVLLISCGVAGGLVWLSLRRREA